MWEMHLVCIVLPRGSADGSAALSSCCWYFYPKWDAVKDLCFFCLCSLICSRWDLPKHLRAGVQLVCNRIRAPKEVRICKSWCYCHLCLRACCLGVSCRNLAIGAFFAYFFCCPGVFHIKQPLPQTCPVLLWSTEAGTLGCCHIAWIYNRWRRIKSQEDYNKAERN